MYEDSCFLQPLFFFFFSQTGKMRRSKCSSMSSRLWFLMASERRWLASPPACCRGGEERERLSGAQHYISGSAGASRKASAADVQSQSQIQIQSPGTFTAAEFSKAPARHIRSDCVRLIWAGGGKSQERWIQCTSTWSACCSSSAACTLTIWPRAVRALWRTRRTPSATRI